MLSFFNGQMNESFRIWSVFRHSRSVYLDSWSRFSIPCITEYILFKKKKFGVNLIKAILVKIKLIFDQTNITD